MASVVVGALSGPSARVDTKAVVGRPVMSNGALAMTLFIVAELMFFSGLISSYLVARAGFNNWPPLGQPRLPIEATAFNTMVLLASGVALWSANREQRLSARMLKLRLAAFLGAWFVVFQGVEWVRLIGFGLTTASSLYGSYFYLIVGAHALHACVGLIPLSVFAFRNGVGATREAGGLSTFCFYWYFVVGLWPVLYALVYLM